jgi:predicted restriction endonuclease
VIIQELKPRRILIPEHEEFYRDPLLSESLKSIYDHRCQVCGNNFQIKYNEPFAETHHIKPLSEQGLDISKNIVVTCPNHHRIIHKTKPVFDESKLLYKYPNGLEERLILTEHFEHSSFWSAS